MATRKYACGKCGEPIESWPNGLPTPCPGCGSIVGFPQGETPKPQHAFSEQQECGATLGKTDKPSQDATAGQQKQAACTRCGKRRGLIDLLTMDVRMPRYVCKECEAELKVEKRQRQAEIQAEENRRIVEERQRQAEIQAEIRDLATKVVITSTHSIDGFKVRNYLGIESFECIIGTGLFSEITTEFQDFFGLRSSAFEQKLQAAKNCAFDALKMRAVKKGANAILGVDLDYTEFSGNRIGLIVNGTLVEVVPID